MILCLWAQGSNRWAPSTSSWYSSLESSSQAYSAVNWLAGAHKRKLSRSSSFLSEWKRFHKRLVVTCNVYQVPSMGIWSRISRLFVRPGGLPAAKSCRHPYHPEWRHSRWGPRSDTLSNLCFSYSIIKKSLSTDLLQKINQDTAIKW